MALIQEQQKELTMRGKSIDTLIICRWWKL